MTAEQTTNLAETLESMFECIANGRNIMTHMERIEALQGEIGSAAPPMLRHYLERRSYTKALDFLKYGEAVEEAPPPGSHHESDFS